VRIAVASGKGGTGKTTVAVNLALAIKDEYPVQLLDCDVEEPNVFLFMNPEDIQEERVTTKVPVIFNEKCSYCGCCSEVCSFNALAVLEDRVMVFPELCHSCGVCAYLCPCRAISEKDREIGTLSRGYSEEVECIQGKINTGEAFVPPVIKAVKKNIAPGKVSILDAPPGTSCAVVTTLQGSDFCLLVTEPTPFGLHDLALAVGLVEKLGIPAGVVINRCGIGDVSIENYCLKKGIPVLLKIPFDRRIAELYSRGISLVNALSGWRKPFKNLFHNIREMVCRAGTPGN